MKGPCKLCGRDTYSDWLVPSRDVLPLHIELTPADIQAWYKSKKTRKKRRK